MSPTAQSRSPARIRSSVSTDRASGSRPTVSRPMPAQVGRAAGRDEQLVGHDLAAVGRDPEAAVVVDPLDRHAGLDPDALVARTPGVSSSLDSGSSGGQDPVGHLEDGHLGAEPREGLGELAADRRRRRSPRGSAGSSVTFTISRLVQYGVSASPSIGSVAGDVPTSSTTPRAPTYVSSPTRTRARCRRAVRCPRTIRTPAPSSRSTWESSCQWLVACLSRRSATRPQSGCDLGRAGEVVDPTGLAEGVGGADHHLRRHAAVERALAADQVAVDPDHVEPRLGELLRGVLPARAESHHHHVHVVRRHVAPACPTMCE